MNTNGVNDENTSTFRCVKIVLACSSFKTISSGSTDTGDVAIDLTPRFTNGKLFISVAANTHSVDLSQFDLSKLIVLESGGKKYYPSSVPKLSGHHSNGQIIFDVSKLSSFTIAVSGIPSEQERNFKWQ